MTGTPFGCEPLPQLTEEDKIRLFTQTKKEGECWVWQGNRDQGYGRIMFRGQRYLVHRAAWILAFGPIPPGMCVCHACDNPPCINPAHLWLGPHAENIADCKRKGRNSRGERQRLAKLTADDVRQIRHLREKGLEQQEIAGLFNCHNATISRILAGKIWGFVE
jgi:hypothetical protein